MESPIPVTVTSVEATIAQGFAYGGGAGRILNNRTSAINKNRLSTKESGEMNDHADGTDNGNNEEFTLDGDTTQAAGAGAGATTTPTPSPPGTPSMMRQDSRSNADYESVSDEEDMHQQLSFEEVYQDDDDEGDEFEYVNPLYSYGDNSSNIFSSGGGPSEKDNNQGRSSNLIEMMSSPPIGTLRITIVEGSGLRKVSSKQNPQIRLSYDGINVKSIKESSGGTAPRWNITDPSNTLDIPIFKRFTDQDSVSVEVWDLSDKFIGAGSITSLEAIDTIQRQYRIELLDEKSTSAGMLTFLICYQKATLKEQVSMQQEFFLTSIPKKIIGIFEETSRALTILTRRLSKSFIDSIKGGSLTSWFILLALCMPYILLTAFTSMSLASRQWFLVVPLTIYGHLCFPHFLGRNFAAFIKATALHGYPGGFKVGTIHIKPWIREGRFHCIILAEDCSFGNPPGFPFQDFARCGRVSIQGSATYRDIIDAIFYRLKPCPLKKVPDFKYLALFDIHHVEFDDVMLDFQLYEGKFNIPYFTELLAAGEAKDHGWMKGFYKSGDPIPNQLEVKVIRAKGLRMENDDGKKTFDPYVVLRIRRDKRTSRNQTQTRDPMFNEEFFFNINQCSAVFVLEVWSRETIGPDELLGQWQMTMKWMLGDPYYCWHEKGLEVTPDRRMRGWFPLMNKKWRGVGQNGKIEMQLHWKYVPEHELKVKLDLPPQTAMEQLNENSEETLLRAGDFGRLKHWLNHEPVLFDIHRVTVRNIKFYLQDLFRGFKGKAESKGKAEYIHIDRLEYFTEFRPKHGDLGITTFKVVYHFFRGIAPKIFQAASGAHIGGAISQITLSSLNQIGNAWKHLFTGKFEKVGMVQSLKGVATLGTRIDNGFQHLHRVVTQNKNNEAQYKFPVTADDTDFLVEHPSISGHLDRNARPLPTVGGEISVLDLAKIAKTKSGGFKKKYMELKNQTVFYKKQKIAPSNSLFNVTYKIDFRTVTTAYYFHGEKEIILVHSSQGYMTRLRNASSTSFIPSSHSDPSISAWFESIKLTGVKCVDVE